MLLLEADDHHNNDGDDDDDDDHDDDEDDTEDDPFCRLAVMKRLNAVDEDVDALEVLSLCNEIGQTYDSDEVEVDDDDDDEELTIDQLIAGAAEKSLNSSFGTATTTPHTATDASSCSNKSLPLSDDADVVLRNHHNTINHHLSDCSLPCSGRFRPQALSTSSPKFARAGLQQTRVASAAAAARNARTGAATSRVAAAAAVSADVPLSADPLVRRDAFGSFDRRPFALHIGSVGGGGSGGISGGGSVDGGVGGGLNGGGVPIAELPSPSSASLHSGNGRQLLEPGLLTELTAKSNSAPVLLKQREQRRRRDEFGEQTMVRLAVKGRTKYVVETKIVCTFCFIHRISGTHDHRVTDI